MNDCEYGYMVHDNIIDLNLLRSPNNPDPDADMGDHNFIYSFFPHKNNLIDSNVISEASCLNQKPLLFRGVKSLNKMPLFLESYGLELSILKKAEKKECLVFRIIEKLGREAKGVLHLSGQIIECDLIEWREIGNKIEVKEKLELNFKPFEIRTFFLKNI